MGYNPPDINKRDKHGLPIYEGKSLFPVIEDIAIHGSISKAAREHGFSPFLFYAWRKNDPILNDAITVALQVAADDLVEACDKESDNMTNENYQVARERIRHYTWKASKLYPRAYGNDAKVQTNVQVNIDVASAIREASNRRRSTAAVIDQANESDKD